MLKRSSLLWLPSLPLRSAPAKPLTLADLPAINTDRILQDIKKLSSDEFEGARPDSKGETLTKATLIETAQGHRP
jgi:hypothetical protein